MAGHREDGTVAEDKAHHPARKVPNPRLSVFPGTSLERTYKYGLGVVTTNEDGTESHRHVGLSDSPSTANMYKAMVGVQRPNANERYEYTEDK